MARRRTTTSAREFRLQLLRCIWRGARQLGEDFDPRQLAPDRLTGIPGETLSKCSIEELLHVAYQIKKAGAHIWVPAIPKGLHLKAATPIQLKAIRDFLSSQTYLKDPDQFFRKRLGIEDPQNPTFKEAQTMLAYFASKRRARQCA